MSERGSFCTQFIYDGDLAQAIYDALLENRDTLPRNHSKTHALDFQTLTLETKVISGFWTSSFSAPTWEFERMRVLIKEVCDQYKEPCIQAVFISDSPETVYSILSLDKFLG